MSINLKLIFILCILPNIFASIEYKYVAKTTSGKPCLNTCKNESCYIDYELYSESCTIDYLAGVPTYYTSMYEGNIPTCLSNCDKFGYDYEWCFTTENYDWDYCSSKVYSYNNMNGYDMNGYKCLFKCAKNKYYSCVSSVGDTRYCAKPATISTKSCYNGLFKKNRSKRALDRIFDLDTCSLECRRRVFDGRDGQVQELIDNIYSSNYVIQNETNIGYPFTFVAYRTAPNNNGDIVYLPLIIQATLRQIPTPIPRSSSDITSEARTNVRRMYNGILSRIDVGHMISFQNGGTTQLFNYVGQTATLNRGTWKTMENEINNWINYEDGTVQMTIVVTYAGTIPTEFAVKLKFINGDGTLHSDCLDIIFRNV
ncbi:unknown similar to MacoNPV-B orf57 [Mythimna separata entomopoxvirus 'L']|uniref:Type VII secretion system protein EssD-like domain-containing protein n=1 Tax=Mythimna separata entomopoxvirus 'L' TaxID=1293572 RepID=A0A916KQ48_9POXV|nr:unknown similar to MacoNPV-B orf57 [Mythimna separata entomopoxvirus 'L']CCU56323.1 unknown similar to MacoNPV-B orf57 [Mythimna separata entomopoxvirus 'L']